MPSTLGEEIYFSSEAFLLHEGFQFNPIFPGRVWKDPAWDPGDWLSVSADDTEIEAPMVWLCINQFCIACDGRGAASWLLFQLLFYSKDPPNGYFFLPWGKRTCTFLLAGEKAVFFGGGDIEKKKILWTVSHKCSGSRRVHFSVSSSAWLLLLVWVTFHFAQRKEFSVQSHHSPICYRVFQRRPSQCILSWRLGVFVYWNLK